jgi:HK97 family phage major capsid protein
VALVEEDGFYVTGHVADISMKAKLRGLRDANGNPIFSRNVQDAQQWQLDGEPIVFPRNGSMDASQAHQFCGAWDYLVYAWRQDISWMLSDQGVIQDASGEIVYNLFQQDMVALRMVMRLGVQLPNPVNRLNESESTRYPFAALIP